MAPLLRRIITISWHAPRLHSFLKEQSSCQRWHNKQWKVSRQGYNNVPEGDEISKKGTLIWRAVKLPIYSVALVPLTVAAASSYLQSGVFPIMRYFMLLGSSILIITWLNLCNDVYDFDTGADKNKKESVVNLAGSLCMSYSWFCGLTWVSVEAGNLRAISLLACAIFCGYIYQCPPFRLSYRGLGEPLCFAAFGPFATTGFYMLMGKSSSTSSLPLTHAVLCASALVGFTTSLILFCSHFHQVKEDVAAGKISPLVRLGTEKGSLVVKAVIATLYILLLAFGLSRSLPCTSILLCLLTLPMGYRVVHFVGVNHKDKKVIFMAKYYCVRLHALFGAALAIGLVAEK